MSITFWTAVTLFGTPELWLGIAAGIALFYIGFRKRLRKRRTRVKRFAFMFMLSLLLAFLIVQGIKNITRIPRPCTGLAWCEQGFSFPSGHAAAAFVSFTTMFIAARKRWFPAIIIFIVPVLIAWSRVALGVHTEADIIVGSLIGIAVPWVVWITSRWNRE